MVESPAKVLASWRWGSTGKAAQWKEAYIETFDRMEAALTSGTPDRITPAQAQHLKEAG